MGFWICQFVYNMVFNWARRNSRGEGIVTDKGEHVVPFHAGCTKDVKWDFLRFVETEESRPQILWATLDSSFQIYLVDPFFTGQTQQLPSNSLGRYRLTLLYVTACLLVWLVVSELSRLPISDFLSIRFSTIISICIVQVYIQHSLLTPIAFFTYLWHSSIRLSRFPTAFLHT